MKKHEFPNAVNRAGYLKNLIDAAVAAAIEHEADLCIYYSEQTDSFSCSFVRGEKVWEVDRCFVMANAISKAMKEIQDAEAFAHIHHPAVGIVDPTGRCGKSSKRIEVKQ